MIAKAEARYVRISPSKVWQTLDLVRGKSALKAIEILNLVTKKASPLVSKVIKSAMANAKNKGFSEKELFISKIAANTGPFLKRFRAASFGRAAMIRKRTSHLIVELDSNEKIIDTTAKIKTNAVKKLKTEKKK